MGRRTNTAKWMEKQKRWQINVQKDGKRRTFTSSTPGRAGQREANSKADQWLDAGIENTSYYISRLLDDYLESATAAVGTSRKIQINYYVENFLRPQIGHMRISRLNEEHLQDILNRAYKNGYAKATISMLASCINSFVRYCRRRKTTSLVVEDLTIPKNAPTKEKTILQPDSLIKLFESDKTLYRGKEVRDYLINAYRFQVLTGLRPGELLGLEWQDISGKTVRLRRSYNGYKETTKGKNANAARAFNLTPITEYILAEQRLQNPFGRIFGNITQRAYRKRWYAYCEHNGIPRITPYELRHTFVSIVKSLPEGEIKELVGHSRSMDTLGTYSHAIEGEREQTAAKVNSLFTALLKDVL